MIDTSVDPPNSRLFVLCSKLLTEEDLREAFNKYGIIEDIWIVKDRTNNESKGVVYIKFAKSSEAALAMEEMSGKSIGHVAKPIKVLIAHSREQGSRKEDDPERHQRLFIIVPRSTTEVELRDHFKQFGDIDYVSVIKKRETGESKGVAYVKYFRAYHAAKAYEECNRSYKAVFARPREPKNLLNYDAPMERRGVYSGGPPQSNFSGNFGGSGSGGGGGGVGVGGGRWHSSGTTDLVGCHRLIAFLDSSLRDEQIYRIFDIAPGLVDIRPQANRSYSGMQKVLIEYNCPPAAAHAGAKINGFEYPPGSKILVKPYSHAVDGRIDELLPLAKNEINGTMGGNPLMQSGSTKISNNELATLTTALAKAEAIIKSGGVGLGLPLQPGHMNPGDNESYDPTYCSVKLPPPQPLCTPTDEPTHRLFIVCQPGLPSMYALRDIFGRFGSLVEVYILHGKNCGYVTYGSKESALRALKTLHLQEVCGMRIKVMVAEPPRSGPNERKRLRMDLDSDN